MEKHKIIPENVNRIVEILEGTLSDEDKIEVIADIVMGEVVKVTDTNGSELAKESGGNLTAIKTNTDKIPSSPATTAKQDSIITAINSGGKTVSSSTLINNASFTTTVTGSDLNLSGVRNGIITVVLGAKTNSPTITVKLQVKDSNNNYIDYLTLPTMTNGSESAYEEFYDLPFQTGRLVAVFGGSGSFAGVTVEMQYW